MREYITQENTAKDFLSATCWVEWQRSLLRWYNFFFSRELRSLKMQVLSHFLLTSNSLIKFVYRYCSIHKVRMSVGLTFTNYGGKHTVIQMDFSCNFCCFLAVVQPVMLYNQILLKMAGIRLIVILFVLLFSPIVYKKMFLQFSLCISNTFNQRKL